MVENANQTPQVGSTAADSTGPGTNRRAGVGGACCPLRSSAGMFIGGLVLGALVMAGAVWMLMPGMMIVTDASRLGFDETVSALHERIEDQGWVVQRTLDVQRSLGKHGEEIPFRVKLIKLCQPSYAADVLKTDRFVSSLMPCSIAVWEDDAGKVFVSKMNTGLMGKMFGGNIAKVMGGSVAKDEQAILEVVH